MRASFSKSERLSSKKLLDAVVADGKKFFEFPFKVLFLETEHPGEYPVQVVISVPRRKFKKAHDRNRIRRQIREAYRKNKWLLYDALAEKNKRGVLMLIFTSNEEVGEAILEKKIKSLFRRLTSQE